MVQSKEESSQSFILLQIKKEMKKELN